MKTKTPLQKKVVELSSKLPSITDKQLNWGYEKCLYKYAVWCRNTLYCLECGHAWKDDPSKKEVVKNCVCPACNLRLKIKAVYKKQYEDTEYYAVLTVVGGFQVVRMFCLKKFMKKGMPAELFCSEVMQHWIGIDGIITTLQKKVMGFSHYYDLWIFNTNLEIRSDTDRSKQRQMLNPWKVYPQKKILPEIRRNGFKGFFYGRAPHLMFSRLLTIPIYETLLKTNQIELFKKYIDEVHNIVNYWGAIKICIRNGYTIDDPSMYFDYLDLLTHFNKDLRSPKYLCPDNLMQAHDKLVDKKRKIDSKQKLKEQLKKINKHQVVYEKQKQQFFGLQFKDRDLVVKVIDSVREFMEEGDAHRHCVYTNEYYKRQDSLVFSATVDGKRVETVELSLSKLKILQSRGPGNKATKYNKRIIALVRKNLHQVRKVYAEIERNKKHPLIEDNTRITAA